MANEVSDVGEKIALDAITGRATQTSRTTYLTLLTATPSDTTTNATMTEYTATGYSRQASSSFVWTDPGSGGETHNTNLITFGPFSSSPGTTITHAALVSSSSGTSGDFIFWWTTTNRTPISGDSITFAATTGVVITAT